MELLVILLVACYAGVALLAAASAAASHAADVDAAVPEAVVIVAARNEEAALPECIAALLGQRYPGGRLRIVVADDGSTDGTAAVVRSFSPNVDYLLVSQDLGLRGKAAAIHAAVEATDEPVILLTDADCRPPERWARNMAAQFAQERTGVVSGVTSILSSRAASPAAHRLARMQALDWTLLLTVAAGLSGAGVPLTAMGNNMAFRRRAYEDVGGYPALPPSVTEDYALFRAVHRRGWRARLLLDGRLENLTLPLISLKDVFAQRKRWARGGLRADIWVYVIYGLIVSAHVAILAGIATVPTTGIAALAVKVGADAVVLRVGMRQLRRPGSWKAFPFFEAYLFAYVIALPLSLLAAPRITWRGRRF